MILEDFYKSFFSWIELRLSGGKWLWKATLVSVAIALFLAFPPYTLLIDHFRPGGVKLDAWVFIHNQAQDLFHPKDMDYDVRRENMIFRWTLPLFSFLTNGNILIILFAQAIAGIVFLKRIGNYVYSLCQDKAVAALVILSIANTFVSVWTFADVHGYGDGFAYFFLLAALLGNNAINIFVCLQVAFFTDERAVVAGGYLLLWWMVTKAYEKSDFSLPGILKRFFMKECLVVCVAWFVYFGIRIYVQDRYFPNHSYSTIGTPVLFANAHRNGLGSSIWATFEGIWLIILAAFLVLWLTKRYWLVLALLIGFIVLTATGIYVHDLDRALAYGFPFILLSLHILIKTSSLPTIRKILFFTAVICVIHLQVFYMGYNRILWLEPLPVKILMYIDHFAGWHFFK